MRNTLKYFFTLLTLVLTGFVDLSAQNLKMHRVLKTPGFLEYTNPSATFETYNSVIAKLANYPSNVNYKVYNTLKDDLGQTHYRIQMYFDNVPVTLSTGIVHVKDNFIFRINGDFISAKDVQGKKVLSVDQARELAFKYLPSEKYYWQDMGMNEILQKVTKNKDTTYYPKGSLSYIGKNNRLDTVQSLCYKFDVFSQTPLAGKSIYVNAESGEIWATNELILHTEVTGKATTKYSGVRTIKTDSTAPGAYRLRETFRGSGIETYNMKKSNVYGSAVDFTDADNNWNNVNANKDEVATDAHWGAEQTYDYYKNMHGRNSYDNKGALIYSFVHYTPNGAGYDNAFWNGSSMSYGDGATSFTGPLTALDVCGHEITHAVTTNSANLTYANESGALNESFSDVFGETIENYGRPTQWNWKIGEDITAGNAGIRDMSNPNAKSQPKYYKGTSWYPLSASPTSANDYGGVHYNSGVQNYWYYLITMGAKGTNEIGNVFSVDSLGFIKSAKIAYRNLTVYLTAASTYADARTYSIISATDLFGTCSKEVIAVTNAWWVCGVGAKYDSAYVKANFTGDTLACKTSKLVNFFNTSDNYSTAKWYFGDGGTATSINASRNYATYGKFTVKLVVTSCFKGKSDSITKVNFVSVDSTRDICNAILLPLVGSQNESRCWGFVYDDGGESNYGGNKIVATKLTVANADSIRYRFIMLDYENGFDSLVMFQTIANQANKIGSFTGTTTPFAGAWKTVKTNVLIFRQYSDAMQEGKGFKLQYIAYRPKLTIDLGKDTAICIGDTIQLYPSYGGGNASDLFITGPAGLTPGNYRVGPKVTTKYYFKVTDACTRLSAIDSIIVLVRPPIKVKLGNDTTVCQGRNVILKPVVTGGNPTGYKYWWSHGPGFGMPTEMVISTDTVKYFVVVSDGCTKLPDTAYQTVNVLPLLEVVATRLTADVCPGTNVNLKVAGKGGKPASYVFTWDHGLGTGTTKTVSVTDTTTYYITLSDGCSVVSDWDSIQVTIPAPLKLDSISDSTICAGQSRQVTLNASGGRPSTHFVAWTNPAIVGYTPTLNPLEGVTTYSAILSDGCMLVNDTISFNVKKLPPISATWNVSDTKMCLGDSVNVDFTIKGGDSTKYNWVLNGASTNSKINKIALANTQNVTLDLKDGCSPDVNFIQKVVISPSKLNLAILSADSTNCPGTKAAFIEVANTAVNTTVSYKWNDPLLQTTAKITGLSAGSYRVIANDTFGCEDSLSVKVVDYGVVFQAFTDTTIYRGTAIKLRLKNAVASKWFGPSILGKDSGIIITVKPLKDTIYTVVGLDKNGCLGKDTVTVLVIDPLTVRIPNIITPNGDRRNDVWDLIELAELDQYTIIIVDRLGKRVYKSENYGNDWGGKDMDGNELPVGAYFFKMTHRKSFNVIQGYIQIIR